MSSINIQQYTGKKIKIICSDGYIIVGKCVMYTQDIDNEPEIASICIENEETIKNRTLIEIYENEIKSIEVIG